MGTTTVKSLYDIDFVEWADQTAALLREGRIDEIDFEHLIEEIEDLGNNNRKTVFSQLRRMLLHLIKQNIQPERDGPSWQSSISDAREQILDDIEFAPSLRRYLAENLETIYARAVQKAVDEINLSASQAAEIPCRCPYTLDELLDGNPKPWS
jgi:hypothetical protein